MQHDSNVFRGGFTGVGALMDPDFLRDATHPEQQSDAEHGASFRKRAAAAVTRTATWLATLLHRAS